MPRPFKGYSKIVTKSEGHWIARLRISLPGGGTKSFTRQGRNKTHAKQLLDKLEEDYTVGGLELINAENMTFDDLAERYKKAKCIDPIYDGDIKVAGMQSKRTALNEVKSLVEYWGVTPLRLINHPSIEEFKIKRLQTPVVYRYWEKGELVEKKREEPRKMVSVNHELRRLRAMFNFAKRQGWIKINPFTQGESLISEAVEIPRNRAEAPNELERILAACVGKRAPIRALILAMVDTALRLSEVRRLTRGEIHFEDKVAHVRARNTKSNKPRVVPLSLRLIEELRWLCKAAPDDDTPILGEVEHKNVWKAIKEEAQIADGLQLRDLRGWGAGRIARALAKANKPWEHGMKTTGHTQIKTYLRYIKTDVNVAQSVGEALEKLDDEAKR